MLIEGATTPEQEVHATTPAQEVETETTDTAPEVAVDEAPEGSEIDQSTDTADGDTSEGTTAEEERRAALREADYTRKTQALAEQRKAVEARMGQLDGIVRQGEMLVQALTDEFQAEFKDVDWGKLAAENPAEYVRLQHQLSQRQQKLQAAVYRLNEARQLQSQTSEQTVRESLESERKALVEAIPEWSQPEKYAAESAEISKFLTSAGYRPEEVQGITDHRAVLLARKAMLYDKLAAQTPKATPVSKAPPPVRAAPSKAPGAKSPAQMTDKEFAEWRKRQIAQRR